jgi:hypothetical protein
MYEHVPGAVVVLLLLDVLLDDELEIMDEELELTPNVPDDNDTVELIEELDANGNAEELDVATTEDELTGDEVDTELELTGLDATDELDNVSDDELALELDVTTAQLTILKNTD